MIVFSNIPDAGNLPMQIGIKQVFGWKLVINISLGWHLHIGLSGMHFVNFVGVVAIVWATATKASNTSLLIKKLSLFTNRKCLRL